MKNDLEKSREIINRVDAAMAELFSERMQAAEVIAEYKRERGLPVRDPIREAEVLRRNAELVADEELRPYFVELMKHNMSLSRAYQRRLGACGEALDALRVELDSCAYDVHIKRGLLLRAGEIFDLGRRVMVVTDDGVPKNYAEAVLAAAGEGYLTVVPSGENTKCFSSLEGILSRMMECGFDRGDCVVAVGGGMVGDLAGLAAALYMRGIDFYNVPTTLLAQVDSSIGGKTAINLGGVKNAIGAFHQPRGVIIDPDVLATLPKKHISAGLAEAVKMAITSDAELFSLFEDCEPMEKIEEIVRRALEIKRRVVEADEHEAGLRKILNFGHTLGHGIEAVSSGALTHGEAVALGMLPVCGEKILTRVLPVLNKIGINTNFEYDVCAALLLVSHDKKCSGDKIDVVFSDKIGCCEIRRISLDDFAALALSVKEKSV